MRLLPFLPIVPVLFHSACFAQQPPAADAAAIMARVAANQDHSEAERMHFVYIQHARVLSRKGKTVRCEEITDSRVLPTPTGSRQQILQLDGRVWVKGKYVPYTQLPAHKASSPSDPDDFNVSLDRDDGETDRDLVENMRKHLTDSKSKDGIGAGLFPLTSRAQAEYNFHLAGRERINDRDTFHITFTYKDQSDFGWKGDAFIDATDFEPVMVRTTMARKVPFAVRTLLGTNVPGLGFTVLYAPQHTPGGADVWFPVSFGTEFKLRVLFFFSRQIILSADNRDFEQTHVTSTLLPAEPSPAF
jgi:hypothetical protein